MANRNGANTLPCLTPAVSRTGEERAEFHLTTIEHLKYQLMSIAIKHLGTDLSISLWTMKVDLVKCPENIEYTSSDGATIVCIIIYGRPNSK
jgi:hypothetical protein